MENKLASHRDMELLKMAMLRHEEIFRQQVHELHRLYRVQKQLMGSPSSSELSCRRHIRVRRRRRQPRSALDLHLHRHPRLPADECVAVVTPPLSAEDDGLELTLAIGSSGGGGRGRRRRRDKTESTGTDSTTPLGSESDISGGGSLTSSSTDTGGLLPYQRAMPAFRRLQQEATTTTTVAKQPPRSPWLVQCVGSLDLEMA